MSWHLFFGLHSRDKTIFIFSSHRVSILKKRNDGLSESQTFAQNWGILHTSVLGHIKMNFDYFQIQTWMLQTVRAAKVDEKNEVICLVSIFCSWKLSKKGHFLQFCVDLSNKSKSVKAIYIYASERSHYTLLENAMVYRSLSHRSWDISD